MPTAFALPTELTIYTVGELRTQWLAWLTAEPADLPGTCHVDGAGVDDVDGAGLQLLLSLARALGNRQRTLQIVNPSRPLGSACEALGLAALLAAPSAAGAAS